MLSVKFHYVYLLQIVASQLLQPAQEFLSVFSNLGSYKTFSLSSSCTMYWYIAPGTSLNRSATIGVVCATSGWVGLGLSDNGGMYGADMAVFRIQSGAQLLENRIGPNQMLNAAEPILTSSQKSIALIYGNQTPQQTSFIFNRWSQASCGIQNLDIKVDGTRQFVIFAYGKTNDFTAHLPENRGHVVFNFSSTGTDQENIISDPSATNCNCLSD